MPEPNNLGLKTAFFRCTYPGKAHPRFETIFKVLNAMGIQMTLVPKVKFRKRRKQTELCVAEKRARYRV